MQRMARFYVHVLVLFLGQLVLGIAINPGFKARVTNKGLKYANDVAIAALAKSVKQITIPDQHGSYSVFDYSIYHIHVTDFNPPESSISLVPGHGLSWTASNAGISIIGDFNYKISWFFEDNGSFDAKVQGVSFGIEIDFGVDASGRPSITARNCGSSIANVDFHFHGGILEVLYNLFRDKVADEIKNQLNSKMCELIVNQINEDGEKQLAKLEVTTRLATNFLLDYRLIQTPSFNSQFMETAHKGEIYWASEATRECPFFPPFMPDNGDTSSMLYLFVSDYLFDSMAYNAQTHGFLKYNLTQKDLPPDMRGYLNTTCNSECVGRLIPSIGERYPNMNVELRMNSTTAPRMNITSQGVNLTFQGMIDLYARKDGVTDTPFLISLLANMSTNVKVSIQNELLYAEIDNTTLNLEVIKSAVGEVKRESIFLLSILLKSFLTEKLNDLGKKGFPLPLTGDIKFQNTKLALVQDTVIISTDLQYTPSKVDDFGGPLKFKPHVNRVTNRLDRKGRSYS